MRLLVILSLLVSCTSGLATAASLNGALNEFSALYEAELGQTSPCRETALHRYTVCSNVLRSEGNAPYVLRSAAKPGKVAVLVHGLSDSPFFMREIAAQLHDQGYTVFVPLLPGHGLRDAEDDMSDSELAERWQAHVSDVMAIATSLSDEVVLGGFSAGGSLAVDYYLDNPDNVAALTLFSGALALSDDAERMAKIWGIKWLALLIDGAYQTHGPNPYKYPNVAGFAGLELMDIIKHIRAQLAQGKRIDVPLFAAHSAADKTTPIHGIKNLLAHSDGPNTFFVIDNSYDVCHADVVVNTFLLSDMRFNRTMANPHEACAIPQKNPLFDQMSMMLGSFIAEL